MTVAQRILTCRVIEKMEKNIAYSKKLGIGNTSAFLEKNKVLHDKAKEGRNANDWMECYVVILIPVELM